MSTNKSSIIQKAIDESLDLKKKRGRWKEEKKNHKKIILNTYFNVENYLKEEIVMIDVFLEYTKRLVEEKGMWFSNMELLRIFAIHYGLKYEHYHYKCFHWLIRYTINRFFYRTREQSGVFNKPDEGINAPPLLLIIDYFVSLLRDLKSFGLENKESKTDRDEGIFITFLPGFFNEGKYLFHIKPSNLTSNCLNFLYQVICGESILVTTVLDKVRIVMNEECLFQLCFSDNKTIKLLSISIIAESLLGKNPIDQQITEKVCGIIFPSGSGNLSYPEYRTYDFDESLSLCLERLDHSKPIVRRRFYSKLCVFVEYNVEQSFSPTFRSSYVGLIVKYVKDGSLSPTSSSLKLLEFFGKVGHSDIEVHIIDVLVIFFTRNRKKERKRKREKTEEEENLPPEKQEDHQLNENDEIEPPLKRRKLNNGDEEEVFLEKVEQQQEEEEEEEDYRDIYGTLEQTNEILEYFGQDFFDLNDSNFCVFHQICDSVNNCDFEECQSFLRLFFHDPTSQRSEIRSDREEFGEEEETLEDDDDENYDEEEEEEEKEEIAKKEVCMILRNVRCTHIILKKLVSMILEDEVLLDNERIWDLFSILLKYPDFFSRIDLNPSLLVGGSQNIVLESLCLKFISFFDRITKEIYELEVLCDDRIGGFIQEEEEEDDNMKISKFKKFSKEQKKNLLNKKRFVLERMMRAFAQTRSSLSPSLVSHLATSFLKNRNGIMGVDCEFYSYLPDILLDIPQTMQSEFNQRFVLVLLHVVSLYVKKNEANSTLEGIVCSLSSFLKKVGEKYIYRNRKKFNIINRHAGEKDHGELTLMLIPLVKHILIPVIKFERCLRMVSLVITTNNNVVFKDVFINTVFPAIVEREERRRSFSSLENSNKMLDEDDGEVEEEEEEDEEKCPIRNYVHNRLFTFVFKVCESEMKSLVQGQKKRRNSGGGNISFSRISREKKRELRENEEKRVIEMTFFSRAIAFVGRKLVKEGYRMMIQNERELTNQNMKSKNKFRVFGEKYFSSRLFSSDTDKGFLGDNNNSNLESKVGMIHGQQQKEVLKHQKEKEDLFFDGSYADCLRKIVYSLLEFSKTEVNVNIHSVIDGCVRSIHREIYDDKKYSSEQINLMLRVLFPTRVKVDLVLRQNIRGERSLYKTISMLAKMIFNENSVDSFYAKILPNVILPHVIFNNMVVELMNTKNMVNAIKNGVKKYSVKSTYEYTAPPPPQNHEIMFGMNNNNQQYGMENEHSEMEQDEIWEIMSILKEPQERVPIRDFKKFIIRVFPTIIQKILGMLADGLIPKNMYNNNIIEGIPQQQQQQQQQTILHFYEPVGDEISYEPRGREFVTFFSKVVMKNFLYITDLDESAFKDQFLKNVKNFVYYLLRKKKGLGMAKVCFWIRDHFKELTPVYDSTMKKSSESKKKKKKRNNKKKKNKKKKTDDLNFFISQRIEWFDEKFRKEFLKYCLFYNYINFSEVRRNIQALNWKKKSKKRNNNNNNNNKKKKRQKEQQQQTEQFEEVCSYRKLIHCFETYHSFLDMLKNEYFFEKGVLGQVFNIYYELVKRIKKNNRFYRDIVLYNLLQLVKRLSLISNDDDDDRISPEMTQQPKKTNNTGISIMVDEDEDEDIDDEVTVIGFMNTANNNNDNNNSNRMKQQQQRRRMREEMMMVDQVRSQQQNYFFEIAFICLPYLYSNEVVVVDIMDFLVLKNGKRYLSFFHQIQRYWEKALKEREIGKMNKYNIQNKQQQQRLEDEDDDEEEEEEEDILNKIAKGNIENKIKLINSRIHEMSSRMTFFEKLEKNIENFESKTCSSPAILKYLLKEIIRLLHLHPKERLVMIMNSKSSSSSSDICSEDLVFRKRINKIFEGTRFLNTLDNDGRMRRKKKNKKKKMKMKDEDDEEEDDENNNILMNISPSKTNDLANRLFCICCGFLDNSDPDFLDLAMSCLGALGLLDPRSVDLKKVGGGEEEDENDDDDNKAMVDEDVTNLKNTKSSSSSRSMKIDLPPEIHRLNCSSSILTMFLIRLVVGDSNDLTNTQKYVIQRYMRCLEIEEIQSLPDHVQLLYRGRISFEQKVYKDKSSIYEERRVFYKPGMSVKDWLHSFLNHLFHQIDQSQVNDHLRHLVLECSHSIYKDLKDGAQVGSFVLPYMIKFVLSTSMSSILQNKDKKKMRKKKKKKKIVVGMKDEDDEEVEGEEEEEEEEDDDDDDDQGNIEKKNEKPFRVILDELEAVLNHFLVKYSEAYDHCKEVFKLLDTLFDWSIHMINETRFNVPRGTKFLGKERSVLNNKKIIDINYDKVNFEEMYKYIFGKIDYSLLYQAAYELGEFKRAMMYFETYMLQKSGDLSTMTGLTTDKFKKFGFFYDLGAGSSRRKGIEGVKDQDKEIKAIFRSDRWKDFMNHLCFLPRTKLLGNEFTFCQNMFLRMEDVCSQVQLSGLTERFSPSSRPTLMQRLNAAEGTGRLSSSLSIFNEVLSLRNSRFDSNEDIGQQFPDADYLEVRKLKCLLQLDSLESVYNRTLQYWKNSPPQNGENFPRGENLNDYRMLGIKSSWRLSKWSDVDGILKVGNQLVGFESNLARLMCSIPSIQNIIRTGNNGFQTNQFQGQQQQQMLEQEEDDHYFEEALREARKNILQSLRWSLTKSYEASIPLLGKLQIISEIEWSRKWLRLRNRQSMVVVGKNPKRMVDEDEIQVNDPKRQQTNNNNNHPILQYGLWDVLRANFDALPECVDREVREVMLSFRNVLYQSIPDFQKRRGEIELSFFRLWKREKNYRSAYASLEKCDTLFRNLRMMEDEDEEDVEVEEENFVSIHGSPQITETEKSFHEYRFLYEKAQLLWCDMKGRQAMKQLNELLDLIGDKPKGKLKRQILMESKFLYLKWKEILKVGTIDQSVNEYEDFENKKVKNLSRNKGKFDALWLTKYNEKFYHRLGKCRDDHLRTLLKDFEEKHGVTIVGDSEKSLHKEKSGGGQKRNMNLQKAARSPSRRRTRSRMNSDLGGENNEDDGGLFHEMMQFKKKYEEHITFILRYYLTSLQYGATGDIAYFSMSRFLVLYFEYGDLVLTKFKMDCDDPQTVRKWHNEHQKLLAKIPPGKFFVSQTHILTRILHENKHVSDTIYCLIELMVKHNSSFMFWGMMSMARKPQSHKNKKDRGKFGRKKYRERENRRILKMGEILKKLVRKVDSCVSVYKDAVIIFNTLQSVAYHRYKESVRTSRLKREIERIFKNMRRHSKMILPTVRNYDRSFFLAEYSSENISSKMRRESSGVFVELQEEEEEQQQQQEEQDGDENLDDVEYVSGGVFISVMGSKAQPKQIELMCDQGKPVMFLIKPSDDGRKDARLMDMFRLINLFFKKRRIRDDDKIYENSKIQSYGGGNIMTTEPPKYADEVSSIVTPIRRFGVTMIEDDCTLVEWVTNTKTLITCVQPEFQRHYNTSRKIMDVLGEILTAYNPHYNSKKDVMRNSTVYTMMRDRTSAYYLRTFFMRRFGHNPTLWFDNRRVYTKSLGVTSIVGYVIGLGDRHLENILFDKVSGRIVHIDFDCTFETGRRLKTPEIVPFRLTRNLVRVMGTMDVEGLFRQVCEVTFRILRKNRETLLTCLSPFLHDPLFDFFSIASDELKKKFVKSDVSEEEVVMRALNRIKRKLQGFYDPCASLDKNNEQKEKGTAAVSDSGIIHLLIQEATNEKYLGAMYPPWNAYI